MNILGIDVGGSGIKGAIVDTARAATVSDRFRIATPTPATPAAVAAAVAEVAAHFDYRGALGCAFPSVMIHGVAMTVGNLDPSFEKAPIGELIEAATACSVYLVNDADAAGVAEMRHGAGRGLEGLVMTVTIGTGLGSALFYNGVLVPNIEIGHMLGKDGQPIELYASARARAREQLDWPEWGERFNWFLERTARVFAPDHFILGGGISKNFDLFRDSIRVPVPVHVARYRNFAGIVGAALVAADQLR